MNGAMYTVEMDEAGEKGKGNNDAGAQYGTGYCDAQCPHDIKFVQGKANTKDWKPNPKDHSNNMGMGHWGSCCAEMDIWEANNKATAYTPHPCDMATGGQTLCPSADGKKKCGDNDKNERYQGLCDKDGCDINPYRNGNTSFYGKGDQFVINSGKPITIVTQFITNDGTDTGDMQEIRRFYVQDGKRIDSPSIKVLPDATQDSITDKSCEEMLDAFKASLSNHHQDDFKEKGGNKAMGDSLARGHVAVFSLWDDVDVNMEWLDSYFPREVDQEKPGAKRGPCAGGDASSPQSVREKYPGGWVSFKNVAIGEIGTTTKFGGVPGEVPCERITPSGDCLISFAPRQIPLSLMGLAIVVVAMYFGQCNQH